MLAVKEDSLVSNPIMTKLWNRLSEEKIDCLMVRILLEGPHMYQFNFEREFCKWKEHKARNKKYPKVEHTCN